MATVSEVEQLALGLTENQRAELAARLLGTLPAVLQDDDEGVAEALRRDAKLDADPQAHITIEQLDAEFLLRQR